MMFLSSEYVLIQLHNYFPLICSHPFVVVVAAVVVVVVVAVVVVVVCPSSTNIQSVQHKYFDKQHIFQINPHAWIMLIVY